MITVVIVGGKLQGIEAAFLAGEAGYKRILIDKNAGTPASGLCEEFCKFDIARDKDTPELLSVLMKADFIIPALENDEALYALSEISRTHDVNIAFDFRAYEITSSKLMSDEMMHLFGIPSPEYNPEKGPCIVKPSQGSGSIGVNFFSTRQEADIYLSKMPLQEREAMILQEYLDGPSYSVEVIGSPGNYLTYAITEIHIDDLHDCNKVTTPCNLPDNIESGFRADAVKIAELLRLRGIMDVEAILVENQMKILEIDARLPSQTPAAVYASTGINMVCELSRLFLGDKYGGCGAKQGGRKAETQEERYDVGRAVICKEVREVNNSKKVKCASYENILVSKASAVSLGEHIMGSESPLAIYKDFCGADIAISGYRDGVTKYSGIFINSADTVEALEARRDLMYDELKCQI